MEGASTANFRALHHTRIKSKPNPGVMPQDPWPINWQTDKTSTNGTKYGTKFFVQKCLSQVQMSRINNKYQKGLHTWKFHRCYMHTLLAVIK
jgi:hypothetical protein